MSQPGSRSRRASLSDRRESQTPSLRTWFFVCVASVDRRRPALPRLWRTSQTLGHRIDSCKGTFCVALSAAKRCAHSGEFVYDGLAALGCVAQRWEREKKARSPSNPTLVPWLLRDLPDHCEDQPRPGEYHVKIAREACDARRTASARANQIGNRRVAAFRGSSARAMSAIV